MFQEIIFSMFAVVPIIVVALSILGWCIESDRVGLGTLLFIGSCVYLGFATEWTMISIIVANIIPVVIGFLIYLGIGIIWAFFKWYLVIEDFTTGLKVHIYNFKQKNNISGELGEDPEVLNALVGYLANKLSDFYSSGFSISLTIQEIADHASPKAVYNKARITAWIAYFPISMMWTLLHDAVRKLFNRIYKSISGSFQAMSDRLTKRAVK